MTILTFALTATAYVDSSKGTLTHACDVDTLKPLCGKVKASSILDDLCATDPDAPATCPACAKKDPRFA